MYGEEGQHNGGNTCYMVNNKNIKHVANPKEGVTRRPWNQRVYKKKKKGNEKNEGDIFLVLVGKYCEIREEGSAVDQMEGSI